jgi:hypothetical protein
MRRRKGNCDDDTEEIDDIARMVVALYFRDGGDWGEDKEDTHASTGRRPEKVGGDFGRREGARLAAVPGYINPWPIAYILCFHVVFLLFSVLG